MKYLKTLTKPMIASITWLELLLALGGFTVLGIWAMRQAAIIPHHWDTWLYMDISLNPTKEAWVLNRYAHIYIQKLFFALFGHPLFASKVYWSFQVFFTGFLVYLNARLLSKENTYLNGLLATVFFLANRKMFINAGTTLVDFTTMMLIALGTAIYLLYFRASRYQRALLVALGVVFFFTVKSKETGIALGALFLGAAFPDGEQFSLSGFIKNLLYLGLGVILGIGAFMVLDGVILGDALFGWRASSWKDLYTFNTMLFYEKRRDGNWYDVIFSRELMLPFLLGLYSLWHFGNKGRYRNAERVVWLVPFTLVLFLTLTMIRASFPLGVRYFYPAFGAISILGGQFIQLEGDKSWREHLKILLILLGGVALFLFAELRVYTYVESLGLRWEKELFYRAAALPAALTGLLALTLFVKKWDYRALLVAIPCIFLISLHTILGIPGEFESVAQEAERGLYPFDTFGEYIEYHEGQSLFVSENIYTEKNMLCRDDGSCKWLFNPYFEANIPIGDVGYSADPADALERDYTYVFLTNEDWESLEASGSSAGLVEGGYVVETEERGAIVFLHKNQKSP